MISARKARQVDPIDDTAALFPGSTGRVLVSVCREDDVKFVGLYEARGIPVLRIGVTDGSASGAGTDARLEIQGVGSWSLTELVSVHVGTMA